MSIFELKLILIVFIILAGISGGLFPLRFKGSKTSQIFFSLGNSFAGGIFLGAALLHLLPDGLEFLGPFTDYPLPFLLAAVSLGSLLFIEKVVFIETEMRDEAKIKSSSDFFPYLLALILSIHSFIAGVALGIEREVLAALVLFVAIIAHKGSAAFALGISMIRGGIIKSRHIKVILLFTCMTPLGILFGSLLDEVFAADTGRLVEGIFDSLAAGTFLYVSVIDIIEEEFSIPGNEFLKFLSIVVGLALMALLAIWA